MNKILLLVLLLAASPHAFSQVPINVQVQILKAEDARRYDKTLEGLMRSPNVDVRTRAALAAGRIGNDAAIPALTTLLKTDASEKARATAAFAVGEIESVKGADVILRAIGETARAQMPGDVGGVDRGRLVEAAGKIAAANAKDPKAKDLGQSILFTLEAELLKGGQQSKETIRLALTAALRARPAGGEEIVRKFLAYTDPNIVADALNTLARLRAKNANRDARDLLATHVHAVVRANAARVLGAAEDKDALDILLKAATTDADSRVRVSAIRSLGALKDARAADKLLEHGEKLLKQMSTDPVVLRLLRRPVPAGKPVGNPSEKNELLEISTTLGRLLPNSRNERAIRFLDRFITMDDGQSAEISIARLRVAPGKFSSRNESKPISNWRQYSTLAQILGEFAKVEATTDEAKKMKQEAPELARMMAEAFAGEASKEEEKFVKAGPDFLRAFAEYKTDDLVQVLRDALKNKDVFIRATAAELLTENTTTRLNPKPLEEAFAKALASDKQYNDAQLAILDAMFKVDKAASVDTLYAALDASDYLVRKKAFELLSDPDLLKKYPGIYSVIESSRAKKADQVLPYNPKTGTKLGQVLNRDADYRRAALRRNGTVKAVLTTEKGAFTIDLLPEDAPLTVDNFIKLANARYFNGVEVHRVVPNFVMQDGDPRGDGNGGPGWSIRCEINMVPYERGAVGMALSGKDTGGSQWFVTHSPQPHLDGGYTVFGKVNDAGMKVVDNIVQGDKILTVRVIEGNRRKHDR